MNLVGVSGKAGAGKDVVAERLVAAHDFVRIALADVMKRLAAEVFGFTRDQLWGSSGMRNAPDPRWERAQHQYRNSPSGPYSMICGRCGEPASFSAPCRLTAREALQKLGTEYGRAMHEDVWVRYAIDAAQRVLSGGHRYTREIGVRVDPAVAAPRGVVISDVRFDNEALAIRASGGWVLRVNRSGAGLRGIAGAHASEAGLPDDLVDIDVANDSTIEGLELAVDTVMGSYGHERLPQAG